MSARSLVPPPPLAPDLARGRVEAALAAAPPAPALALLAPGGYGKTCALRAWWSGLPGPRAWLAVAPDGALDPAAVAAAAAAGGWVVVDGVERLAGEPAQALLRAVEDAAAGARWVLAGRAARALPLARWRAEGRLHALDARALALDAAAWRAAGLEGARDDWGGWWGARLAAGAPGAASEAELGAWVRAAWLDALDDARLEALGWLALLERSAPDRVAIAAGRPDAAAALADAAAAAGPLLAAPDGLAIAPRLRYAVVAAWRARCPERWPEAVEEGVAALLARAGPEDAARAALGAGLGAPRRAVLERAGWRLLLRRDRALLRALLDARPAAEAGDPGWLLDLAWQVTAAHRPHDADAPLLARLPGLAGAERAAALALSAAIGWQYDDYPRLRSAAEAALAAPGADEVDPATTLSAIALGSARLVEGALDDAEAALRRALARATRDALPRAALTAWHRLALLADERDDAPAVARALEGGRRAAATAGLADAPELDALARLEAARALRALDVEGARAALAAGDPAGSTFGAEESFPHRTLRATAALASGDDAALAAEVAGVEAELTRRFLCLKWRTEALVPRVALRARRGDREGLARLAAEGARDPWPASLHADRRAALLAGARLLAGEPLDPAPLQALARARRAAGCVALARTAELVLALARDDDDALLAHVRDGAAGGARLDYLWLAPRCVAALERLARRPELARDAGAGAFLRGLLERLLAPGAGAPDARPAAAPPPADLTVREWEILQLIGLQLTNEQIAARLFVSVATVKTHINRVYAKLGLRTRAEAVLRARALAAAP